MALFTGQAAAADVAYCVTCDNPNQTYVCRVTGQSSRPSDALKLYCVVRTAKEGKHASCTAQRADPSCAGIEKVYSYDGPAMSPADIAEPKVHKLQKKIAREQQAFEKPKGGAPKSLVELGGRAYSASRDRWRKIGGSHEAEAPQTTLPPESQATAAPHQSESLSLQAAPQMDTPAPTSAQATTASIVPSEPSASRAQRMGSAVGGFTRKSWRCMRSLFRTCSEPEPDALQ
ncbi:MAG: hypothetical protein ACR2J1_11120 [Methyloceanibacter sp.]|uniref:hypothetical protein n=1 Tax=Methyloceanibacter sp. TaxID=1965321 RepID=UPI003D9B8BE2